MNTSIRILILEDNPDDAELMIEQLEQSGIQPDWQRVETEADFIAALESLPELILADYHLPQLSGLDALRIVQQRRLDIPFIIVTGALGDELAVECMKQGASDYLLKDRLARLPSALEQALELKKLRAEKNAADEKARQMAFRDALTGLYNRAFFDEEINQMNLGRKFPVSLMMMDVDALKAVNDHHGHAAGDELLRRVARALKGIFRAADVLARIGGDEFAVLLPETDASLANVMLERAREALLKDNLSHNDQLLSLSFGAVTVHGGLLAEAMLQADERMYLEKIAKNPARKKTYPSQADLPDSL